MPDGSFLDAGGCRSLDLVLADQQKTVALIVRPEDAAIEYETREYASAEEFVAESGVDSSGVVQALRDAATFMPGLGDIECTLRELARLTDGRASPSF